MGSAPVGARSRRSRASPARPGTRQEGDPRMEARRRPRFTPAGAPRARPKHVLGPFFRERRGAERARREGKRSRAISSAHRGRQGGSFCGKIRTTAARTGLDGCSSRGARDEAVGVDRQTAPLTVGGILAAVVARSSTEDLASERRVERDVGSLRSTGMAHASTTRAAHPDRAGRLGAGARGLWRLRGRATRRSRPPAGRPAAWPRRRPRIAPGG